MLTSSTAILELSDMVMDNGYQWGLGLGLDTARLLIPVGRNDVGGRKTVGGFIDHGVMEG